MHRISRIALLALSCLVLLSACNSSVPDHARYIPKDALVVVGLNTAALKKKVTWSAITGSKVLDDMHKDPKVEAAMKDIENSGIDFGSTLYFYAKPDQRFAEEAKMSLVAPVDDAKKWEAYIKKTFPEAAIKKVGERTEASLKGNVYAGWDDDVLIVTNAAVRRTAPAPAADDTVESFEGAYDRQPQMVADETATATEMDAAFKLSEDASIAGNDRFKKGEKAGHDISFWMNYDALMNSYAGKQGMGGMDMMNMSSALWKNAALTAGLDFKDGVIDGEMLFYPGDSMRSVSKEFGKKDVDADMLGRLPGQNLNMVMGYHLSPAAMKMLLDKMGVTGMANMFLMQQGLSMDEALNAFTGDMAIALNNFKVAAVPQANTADMEPGMSMTEDRTEPDMEFVYAMKLNNKASFNKIFNLLNQGGMLQPSGPNTYTIPMGTKPVSLVIGDQYVAVSNNPGSAQAFLQGKSGNMPEAARKEVAGHPSGLYVDVQSFLRNMGPLMRGGTDSVALTEMRNLISHATMNGGEFKGDANEYHFSVNFVNKSENSLLQLLHMAQRLQQSRGREVALSN